ncbi:MAG TPA: pectate lyase [Rhodocyclaceae bacterium]|nr:pectate lyase [Rhodocyclaceae bacterium]
MLNSRFSWILAAASVSLAACGGGGSDNASSSAGASSSASSSVASSVASSTSSAASSSSATAVGFLPLNNETAAYTDTRLQITFDAAPTIGTSGYVYVYKASNDTLVDRITVNAFTTGSWVDNATSTNPTSFTSNVLNTFSGTDINSQTAIPDQNTEVDCIGCNVSGLDKFRWVFYTPFTISGNTVTIKLHDGKLSPATSYYVKMDSGLLNGSINGTAFAGISDKTSWAFATKDAAALSYTDLTVDAAGTGDFLTVQGALNRIMAGTSKADASVPKSIYIKNGTYNEQLFVRSVNNLTITGQSRDGVVVQSDNYEQYNPGTGGGQILSTVLNDTSNGLGRVLAVAGGNRPYLAGGRAVLLAEGADLLNLTQFTLKNSHVKTSTANNQAETIYYNSSTIAGSRWTGTYMNFLSTQDTIQTKGWMWIYKSLVAGDVDFVWGAVYGGLLEESELRTVVDPTNTSSGGYVTEARTAYGYPGFVILNSSLTRELGVPDNSTYLSRLSFDAVGKSYCTTKGTDGKLVNANWGCNNIAYINTKMGAHINPLGWLTNGYTLPLTATSTTGFRESGSMDANGVTLNVGSRLSGASTTVDLSGLDTRAEVFGAWNSSTGWTPTATTCSTSACTTSR